MASFCGNCGAERPEGMRFCGSCGQPFDAPASSGSASPPAGVSVSSAPAGVDLDEQVWAGSPDAVLNPVGARSTKYVLSRNRLVVDKGLLGKKNESLELFRVKDVSVKKGMTQRARGVGDVIVTSTDASTPSLTLEGIADPDKTADTIRRLVGEARDRARVYTREGI